MRSWWPLVVALIVAGLLAVTATTPPSPRPASAPPTAFSAERAMGDVREISRAPHPTGSADNARVRAWLVGRLRSLRMTVREAPAAMSAKGAERLHRWSGSAVTPPVVNLVATLPGGDPAAPAVVLMAHYDSVWGSPGAADDGAGVASALEIVRAVASMPRRRPLVVAFTDGEELGLEGGRALVTTDPMRARIGMIVNLETRGGGGRAAMFETGHDNSAMMGLFGAAVRHPSATSLSVLIYELLPNSTDFTPAKKLGLPGFNFAFIGRPALYHSPLATADRLDRGALQDMGAQALDLVAALLAAPQLPSKAPNLVFFDAFGLTLVRYPPVIGWLVVGAAVGLFAVAGWRARARDLAWGGAATVATLVAGAGLLTLVNRVSGEGKSANYYDRLAAIPWLEVQTLVVAAATLALVVAVVPRRSGGVAVGMALPLLVLGVVVQIAAPTAAYVVAWPLLLAGLTAVFAARATPLAVVAAALGTGYLLGFGFFLIEAIGPDTPGAAALPLALIAVLLSPLLPPVASKSAVRVAAGLLVVALGIAVSIRVAPLSPTVPVYSRTPAAAALDRAPVHSSTAMISTSRPAMTATSPTPLPSNARAAGAT